MEAIGSACRRDGHVNSSPAPNCVATLRRLGRRAGLVVLLHEPGCRSGISGDAARQILGHCRPGAGLRSHADFVRARHRRASGMRSRHASPSSDQGPARDAANTARHRSQRDLRAFCAAGADADPGAECGKHRAALPLRPREPDRQVTFMYLRWSTLTDVPKTTLDEPNRPQGALLHNLAKTFEQQNLADVVLYGGQYRDVLRPFVERALCVFVGGAPDQTNPRSCSGGEANIPTAIITHSLAGYMLMDAMSDIYQPPANETVPAGRSAAMKRLMAVCNSTIEVKTPRLSRWRVSLANQPSTALAQEHEVGVKWKVTRGWRASQPRTLGCLWVA